MPQVFDIQKYSIHDGDGIRTSIFFQGCPLRCAWCHNPESQQKKPQLLWNREKCTGCGWCAGVCPQKAITMEQGVPALDRDACIGCGKCVMECLESARAVSGERTSVRELLEAGEKDRVFYEESGGGVTLSGGEVMTAEPFEEVVELCRGFFEKGISVFIDTSGFASWERFESILPYVTAFLYDIKAVNPETHQKWIGVDNRLILENLRKLSAAGADIRLRLPYSCCKAVSMYGKSICCRTMILEKTNMPVWTAAMTKQRWRLPRRSIWKSWQRSSVRPVYR